MVFSKYLNFKVPNHFWVQWCHPKEVDKSKIEKLGLKKSFLNFHFYQIWCLLVFIYFCFYESSHNFAIFDLKSLFFSAKYLNNIEIFWGYLQIPKIFFGLFETHSFTNSKLDTFFEDENPKQKRARKSVAVCTVPWGPSMLSIQVLDHKN